MPDRGMSKSRVMTWILVAFILAAVCGAAGGFLLARQFPTRSENGAAIVGRSGDQPDSTVLLTEQDISSLVSLDVMVVQVDEGYQLQGAVSSDTIAYQLATSDPYQVRAIINGRAGGFACSWGGVVAGDVPVSSGEQTSPGERPTSSGGVTVACTIPEDVTVVPGLMGVMAIALEQPRQVSALPRTAVFGSQQEGVVIVVTDDGERERRDVVLGESDTQYVEIVSGLGQDEHVLAVPLESDLLAAP